MASPNSSTASSFQTQGSSAKLKGILQRLKSPRYLFTSASLFLLTVFMVKVGLSMVMPGSYLVNGLFWPHAGFVLATLYLTGYKHLPALIAGLLAGIYVPGLPPQFWLGYAGAYALAGVVGSHYLRTSEAFSPSLERIRDVGQVMLALVVSSLLSSLLLSCLFILSFSNVPWDEFLRLWLSQWASDGIGILIFAPVVLALTVETEIRWKNRQFFEVLGWLIILIFFGVVIFGNWAPTDTLRYPLELSLFPILAWGAIRFGQRGSTLGILIISLMAVWQILQVFGPTQKYISQSPSYLWAFVGVISVTTLFLGAVVSEIRNREHLASDNENRLRAFINAMPDIAFLVREDGFVEEVFSSQKGIYSSIALKMKGHSIRESLPLKLAENLLSRIQSCLETGVVQVVEYSYQRNERIWWFEGRFSPLQKLSSSPLESSTTQRSVIWVAYEITERKFAESALRKRDSLLQASASSINALLTVSEESKAIREVCDTVGERVGVSRFFVYEYTLDSRTGYHRLICRYEWVDGDTPAIGESGKPVDLDVSQELGSINANLKSGNLISGFSREFDDSLQDLMRRRRTLSFAWAPILKENCLWGIVGMEDVTEERIWEENELSILRLLAASFGGFFLTRENEMELRKAKVSADEANAAKSEFLAMMSHEIRTPMNAIIGFAELINQTEMPEDQREYLNIIQRSGDSLLELINNLLDYSKIESRKVDLEVSPFNLEQIICEVLEMVMVKAREKSLSVDYQVDQKLPEVLLGDAHRIRQIFLNLVNNAVKFTEAGEIWVKVESTPHKNEKKVRLHCRVSDTGIGIPPSKVKRLFKPFTQVDSSTTRKFGGTGLGLVISKRLSEKMNGKMWVESEVESGSTFHFTMDLPYSEEESEDAPDTHDDMTLSADFSEHYPLNLLLAEDEPINQILASEIFRQLGYQVDLAEDGNAALAAIEKQAYDAVFMDVHMPQYDGIEVTRKVREGDVGADRKGQYIIALTAFALEEDRKRCLESGMNDYLSKPIQIPHLKRALENAYQHLHTSPGSNQGLG